MLESVARRWRPALREVPRRGAGRELTGPGPAMLEEINAQPTAAAATLSHWREQAGSGDGELLLAALLQHVERVVIVGCGSSYHAGLAGRLAIERWARVPVDVEAASEFRYRDPILPPRTLVLGISQSGETADTFAAMRLARERGAIVVAVTNEPGSQVTRCSDAALFTRGGLEAGAGAGAIGTFTAQIVLLYSFALRLAEVRTSHPRAARVAEPGRAPARLPELRRGLERLPGQIGEVLDSCAPAVEAVAERLAGCPFFLYLGGHSALPVALEGALRLREIACVPADTHHAGEAGYGPISLLGSRTPVICVATDEAVLPKLLSHLVEVRARHAPVVAVASPGGERLPDRAAEVAAHAKLADHAEDIICVPRADPVLQVPLAVIPLQLLAYHVARRRGLDVDRPSAPAWIAAVK